MPREELKNWIRSLAIVTDGPNGQPITAEGDDAAVYAVAIIKEFEILRVVVSWLRRPIVAV